MIEQAEAEQATAKSEALKAMTQATEEHPDLLIKPDDQPQAQAQGEEQKQVEKPAPITLHS